MMNIRLGFILAIMSAWALPSYPIVFDTMCYQQELTPEHKQTIFLLGDCHEYLKELDDQSKKRVRKLSGQQRNDIIALAQKHKATVLVEDMVYGIPHNLFLGLPTMITLAMDRYFKCYHPQVITNFTLECRKNHVDAYSIECRHADSIMETPPPYLNYVISKIKKIYAFASCLVTPISAFIACSVAPCHVLISQLLMWSTTTTLTPKAFTPALKGLLTTSQLYENRHIITQAKKLHRSPKLQQKIQAIEHIWQHNPAGGIDELVDLNALNFIANHPEKKVIMVCAGAWHIEHIADFLEDYGYHSQPIQPLLALDKPIEVNAEMGPIKPLALEKTFADTHLSLA